MPTVDDIVAGDNLQSQRAVYDYDQQVKIHKSAGMLVAENEKPVRIELVATDDYTRPPLHEFFLIWYKAAYANEINTFFMALGAHSAGIPVGRDGLNALMIARAALAFAQSGKAMDIALITGAKLYF